jgi:DNA polymerase III alpha subunit
MLEQYEFECGCSLPILNDELKDEDGLPSLDIDFYNLNHKCPATMLLYAEGRTKGVFQLEKSLGQSYSKKVQPCTIEEISALIALIRPGTLKAIVDGKTMTQHYIDRKNGEEEFQYFHPAAEAILDKTYGVIVYQEQTLAIATLFAGFTKVQADSLRKAMGKKLADVMAECRGEFIEGCEKTGIISNEDAVALFDIIEKSNRYSFNKAHSVSYAETGYWVAWVKAHLPLHFYTASLSLAFEKQKPREEIRELILDSKATDVKILAPLFTDKETDFYLDEKQIRFGIGNIRDIGESKVTKILELVTNAEVTLNKSIKDFTYYELQVHILSAIDKTSASNLISSGAMGGFGIMRKKMLFDYKKLCTLTPREIKWVREGNFTSIEEAFDAIVESKVPTKNRKESIKSVRDLLKNPPEALVDSTDYIASIEEELLGIPIVCSKLDSCDTTTANCTCLEFSRGKDGKNLTLAVQLDRISPWTPPDGKNKDPLAFISCHDDTGGLDGMIYSEVFKENKSLLFKGNTVLLVGSRNKKGNLTIFKVHQI